VNMVVNLGVSQNFGKFLSSWATVRLSRRTGLQWVSCFHEDVMARDNYCICLKSLFCTYVHLTFKWCTRNHKRGLAITSGVEEMALCIQEDLRHSGTCWKAEYSVMFLSVVINLYSLNLALFNDAFRTS
jgi:hypothetical protein